MILKILKLNLSFGDKKIKFRCKLKIFGGILKKQGLQMLNKGANLSLFPNFRENSLFFF